MGSSKRFKPTGREKAPARRKKEPTERKNEPEGRKSKPLNMVGLADATVKGYMYFATKTR